MDPGIPHFQTKPHDVHAKPSFLIDFKGISKCLTQTPKIVLVSYMCFKQTNSIFSKCIQMLNAHLKKIDPPTWLDFRKNLPAKLTKNIEC